MEDHINAYSECGKLADSYKLVFDTIAIMAQFHQSQRYFPYFSVTRREVFFKWCCAVHFQTVRSNIERPVQNTDACGQAVILFEALAP